MSVELLNQDTVVEYLIDKKVISSSDNPQVEVLTGGVSNVVLAITTSNQKLVLKQALAELAVSENGRQINAEQLLKQMRSPYLIN